MPTKVDVKDIIGRAQTVVGREEEFITEWMKRFRSWRSADIFELTDGTWQLVHRDPMDDGSIVIIVSGITEPKKTE